MSPRTNIEHLDHEIDNLRTANCPWLQIKASVTIVADFSPEFNPSFRCHRSSDAAQWRACKTWNPKDLRLLVRAPGAPLFFFQQCSPVGIAIFTGEDSQSE